MNISVELLTGLSKLVPLIIIIIIIILPWVAYDPEGRHKLLLLQFMLNGFV